MVLKCVSEICQPVSGPEQGFPPSVELPSSHFLFWFRDHRTEAS